MYHRLAELQFTVREKLSKQRQRIARRSPSRLACCREQSAGPGGSSRRREAPFFSDGEAILIAVSGGLDSMVLLHLLARLAPAHHWRLTVAHFNHQLRGRSSDAVKTSDSSNAPSKNSVCRWSWTPQTSAPAQRGQGISLEMAARELRHNFLARTALKRKIRVIALAHHADDQVELFFLRLLRGAGVEGLAGMKRWRNPSPSNPHVTLARPVLAESKAELQKWADQENIPFREDATNAQTDIRRNRVRHELLPLLRGKYQPALAQVILRQMDMFSAQAEFVSQAAENWFKAKRPPKFDALPIALQRSCLQLQLAQRGVLVNFDLIEQIRESPNRPVNVSPKTSVLRDAAGRVQVQPARKLGFSGLEARRLLKGRAGEFLFDNVRVLWEVAALPIGTRPARKNGVNCEVFDADKVGYAIGLRHWGPGDRFQPIGMVGAVKLQDMFVNQKIPRAERRRLTVATTAAGDLFWVEGLHVWPSVSSSTKPASAG